MAGEPSSDQVFNSGAAQSHDPRTPGLNSIMDVWGYFQYWCSGNQSYYAGLFVGVAGNINYLLENGY